MADSQEKIMNISLRLEEHRDYEQVENLTREAFWDLYRPGCCEHWIVHKIRNDTAFVRQLSYVACDGETIVGNIIYSRAGVVSADKRESEVLCMGPVAVMPACQKKGVGSMLINTTIDRAGELGFKAIILFGNPAYYQRFGFRNAKHYSITTGAGDNMDAFMALELYDGALDGITGKFFASPVFDVKDREVEAFDRRFPYKEKHVTKTQFH